jgi:hypothetical protein
VLTIVVSISTFIKKIKHTKCKNSPSVLLPQIKEIKGTLFNVPNAQELMVGILTAQRYSEIMVNITIIPVVCVGGIPLIL